MQGTTVLLTQHSYDSSTALNMSLLSLTPLPTIVRYVGIILGGRDSAGGAIEDVTIVIIGLMLSCTATTERAIARASVKDQGDPHVEN